MKKSVSVLALLFTIGSMTFVNAFDNPSSSMALLKRGSTIKLLYKAPNLSDVKVLILNEDKQIVFSEKFKNTNGFVRPYNFSSMPDGNYSIQLIDNTGETIQHVDYRSENVIKPVRSMHVRWLSGVKNKFVLSVPNQGQDKITVTIHDQERVLYSGSEIISGDFARIYNLKDYTGAVTFKVTDSKGRTNSLTKESL